MKYLSIILVLFLTLFSPLTAQETKKASLSSEELLKFRNKIKSCWIVPPLGSTISSISIELFMKKNGQVDEIKLLSEKKDNNAQTSIAFASVKRAILKCEGNGYNLPKEFYEQWKNIKIVFLLRDRDN
tara:strand:- start:415 stop:798 length:384 start_codon:yes stop_codon:yes gene_type:complete